MNGLNVKISQTNSNYDRAKSFVKKAAIGAAICSGVILPSGIALAKKIKYPTMSYLCGFKDVTAKLNQTNAIKNFALTKSAFTASCVAIASDVHKVITNKK